MVSLILQLTVKFLISLGCLKSTEKNVKSSKNIKKQRKLEVNLMNYSGKKQLDKEIRLEQLKSKNCKILRQHKKHSS